MTNLKFTKCVDSTSLLRFYCKKQTQKYEQYTPKRRGGTEKPVRWENTYWEGSREILKMFPLLLCDSTGGG